MRHTAASFGAVVGLLGSRRGVAPECRSVEVTGCPGVGVLSGCRRVVVWVSSGCGWGVGMSGSRKRKAIDERVPILVVEAIDEFLVL